MYADRWKGEAGWKNEQIWSWMDGRVSGWFLCAGG